MNKKLHGLIVSPFLAFAIFVITPYTIAIAEERDYFEQQKLTSHLLINLFLQKLKQERLIIFQHAISGADLIPYEVSYAHDINDDSVKARLHFKLKNKKLVPGFKKYYVEGIVVEMDKDGKIQEVSTQVYRQPEQIPDID